MKPGSDGSSKDSKSRRQLKNLEDSGDSQGEQAGGDTEEWARGREVWRVWGHSV